MSGERILIADDEEHIRDLCARALMAEGYQVRCVADGLQAVEAARQEPFDLLLTDILMPGLRGLEVARAIQEFAPDIVCVVITGHGTMDMVIEALKLGFYEFVAKPFTPDELIRAVNHALERERLRRENVRLKALLPLFELNKVFMSTVDVPSLLQQVAEVAHQAVRVDHVLLALLDAGGNRVLAQTVSGSPLPDSLWAAGGQGQRIARQVMQSGQQLIVQGREDGDQAVADLMVELGIHALIVTPLAVKSGHPLGILWVARDTEGDSFTGGDPELLAVLSGQAAIAIENARLFEETQRAYQELQQLDRLKSEFINIAAHELRTPLAILMGHADLLETELTGELRERARTIVRNSMRLRDLITEMTDLRHLATGEMRLRLEELSIEKAIGEVVLDMTSLARAKHQTIAVDVPDDLRPVRADPQKLYTVLSNLLSNAIKFTPPAGRIGIRALERGDAVQVLVWDTGPGIPDHLQDKIFTPFYQVEQSLTRQHAGMGLGLSIVRGMVELWGGQVWVESEVGKGSTFAFTIPRE
ncbi:MAG: ATP-binding protein [Anaerolineae bacterium]|jgi:signal transduction histidine kinase|nr:ATP-binding protein [Anaerolineae bacterium]MDH7474664.1 ATP-binding protein [Anaerolineae bacterium]